MVGWFAASALAGGFEVAQQSAIASGTGHAGTARDGDPAAAWFDPAALADSAGFRFAVGAAFASSAVRATGADGWTTRTENPLGTPPHVYASWSGHGALVGVALNAPFAGGVRWPDDSPMRFVSLETTPKFFRIGPFVGADLGPVRIAVGPHADLGSLDVRQATDHVTEEGTAHLLLRGSGIGGDASVYVAVAAVAVGLSYKSRTRLPLAGEADFDVPVAFERQLPDQTVTADWRLPDRLALGQVVTLAMGRLVADQTLTLWSVNDTLPIDFSDPATPDIDQVNAWQDALALRVGGEMDVAEIVTLRLGAYVDGIGLDGRGPAVVPTETLGPASPDGIRLGATVGGGTSFGDMIRVDGFGEYMAIPRRVARGSEVPLAEYVGHAVVLGATVSIAL